MRIIVTNDDGIAEYESRLRPMVEELREFAEVLVVVSDQDRSGSSNFLTITREVSLESRLVYRSPATEGRHSVEVHSVNGFPADCVVLGVFGLSAGQNVDLVLSGPNGGPNLAEGWFGSGTIGAARTAAFLGVPAVALSGLDSDESDQVTAAAEWIAKLVRSDVVANLQAQEYLTVALPRIPPEQIRGIRVGRRAAQVDGFHVAAVAQVGDPSDEDGRAVWTFEVESSESPPQPGSDVALYTDGFIVVTPMSVDEHDYELIDDPERFLRGLPAWASPR